MTNQKVFLEKNTCRKQTDNDYAERNLYVGSPQQHKAVDSLDSTDA